VCAVFEEHVFGEVFYTSRCALIQVGIDCGYVKTRITKQDIAANIAKSNYRDIQISLSLTQFNDDVY